VITRPRAIHVGIGKIALLALLLALPLPWISPAAGQSATHTSQDYALIYGTVWSPDNRPIAGVPIKIRRASDKKPKWELVSDHNGEFAQRVPAGGADYVIQADLKMRKGQAKPEIKVHIDDNERKDVGIHLTQEQMPAK
jgi:hypothetical protein